MADYMPPLLSNISAKLNTVEKRLVTPPLKKVKLEPDEPELNEQGENPLKIVADIKRYSVDEKKSIKTTKNKLFKQRDRIREIKAKAASIVKIKTNDDQCSCANRKTINEISAMTTNAEKEAQAIERILDTLTQRMNTLESKQERLESGILKDYFELCGKFANSSGREDNIFIYRDENLDQQELESFLFS